MSDNANPLNMETLQRRAAVPDTRALQESILLETQSMPQQAQLLSLGARRKPWLPSLQIALPVAVCLLVATFVAGPLLTTSEPESQNATLLSDDLEWQELMLQEDELLLAQL